MISGPFVLRKTKAARSAPVQVQPAQPVARVVENTSPCSNGFSLKGILQGGAIGFSLMAAYMSILGVILNAFGATMFGLLLVLPACICLLLSMVVD